MCIRDSFYYLSTFENGLDEVGDPLIDQVDSNFINRNIKENSTIVVNNEESFKYINSIINDQVRLQYKPISSIDMINLSYVSYIEQKFEDLAYCEPLYVKKPYVT